MKPDCKNWGSGVPILMAADKPCPQLQPSLCKGAYYCGTNNCGPFNINGSFGGFDDCCVGSPKCNTGDNGCCDRGGYKCGYGEGDCDYDSDCAGNLHCGSNNCKQFGEIFDSTDDCCV